MTTVVAGLVLLFVTGRAVTRLLGGPLSRDPLSSAAVQLGVGLATLPLIILWTSVAGLQMGVESTRWLVALLVLYVSIDAVRRFRRDGEPILRLPRWSTLLPFGAIAAATALTRYQHIRDLALPVWVDSTHHMMIVRLLVERGSLPSTYEPYIPGSNAYYHWGYHAIMSAVIWLTGRTDPFAIARAMLDFGQLLNALTILPMYAAGRALFRSQRAGLWAAALAALVSYFPAYYVSWGRYTHLCGTLLLPLIPIAVARIRTRNIASISCAAILSAGLALIHVRLAFFAATALVVLAASRIGRRGLPRFAAWGGLVLLSLTLTAPWLVELGRNRYVHQILSPPPAATEEWDTPTAVRADLARAPRNLEMFVLGTGGIAGLYFWHELDTAWRAISVGLWLATMLLSEFAHRRRRPLTRLWRGTLALAMWAGLTALALNLQLIGLPRLRIASNASAVITLYVPLCLCLAGLVAGATATLLVRRRSAAIATSLAIITLATISAATFTSVVNPSTVLASGTDLEALRWIRANTPANSVFMVRTRPWLGRSRMGIDGGAWIQLLTDREATLPPGLYPWVAPADTVERIEATLRELNDAPTMPDADLCELLHREGVTHLYFGDSDEGISPRSFSSRSFARTVYEKGRVMIIALDNGCGSAGPASGDGPNK